MQISDSFIDNIANQGHNRELTPYLMFKYAIKTEITKKYYERRFKKFFDFLEFEIVADKDIEYRCNKFVEKTKDNTNWALSQIIRFLQYQKESGKQRNYIRNTKKFCKIIKSIL